ncbi:hypothetical protein [Pedobacter jeongneungensis]|uniref:hypothetical protein n=1 Tax=Pedobacter jeongneungensis TaxID=947309 RepID=UPI0013B3C0F4|nr:hypothetical protein [Pedobacter jeongneungensis]
MKLHSKGITLFILFWSLFTFSNNSAGSVAFQYNQSSQTEWVSHKRKHFTTPVLFRKAIIKTSVSIGEYLLQIFTFNRLLAVKLAELSLISLSIPRISRLFVQEAISQYPTEKDHIS